MTTEKDKTTHQGEWGQPQSPRYTQSVICPVWQDCTKPQCFKHGCIHAIHFANNNQSNQPTNKNSGDKK